MTFFRKRAESEEKLLLENKLGALEEKILKCEEFANEIKELKTENNLLKEEQEKLRIKHWHLGFEYDRLISKIEIDKIERDRPQNKEKLSALKNKFAGQTCFLIGNGPSLKAADLDLIKNIPCFGCNKINQIYGQTSWRPDFYFCTDEIAYADMVSQLSEEAKVVFLPIDFKEYITEEGYKENLIFYPLFRRYCLVPEFSDNPLRGVYDAGTVLYIAAQFAIYMGFKEIILLGVDAQWKMMELPDGRKILDLSGNNVHFYQGDADEEDSTEKFSWMNFNDPIHSGIYDLQAGWRMLSYQAEHLGINIINATRGGSLEVFPRETLEVILNKIG